MGSPNYDVLVVGAGSAGLTAAIGLARAGFRVAVLEAAPYPGAESWSGCVYFCENLAHPDILGPDGVESLAWERRLVERGFFATDGHGLLGMTYRDPEAFRHCYTVLRPIYDQHMAQVAVRHGAALLNRTTAESLIREGGRVVGVSTNRGPLYANLVFLAEGDASHLVTREGYERFTDKRRAPKFLQGIKLVLELPAALLQERFGIGPEEGVAYEMLLRNGSLRGRSVHLNMGGFVYTNRDSLSVGLVLPADNLREHFDGDPNLLIEWLINLPALQPWLGEAKRGTFGAKLIRGGGAKDIPTLIDEGLAIGGAASAVGIDFPYPNFTGPATAMGLLLTQAARRIRAEGGRFTRASLQRHYLEPLQRTHYWQDVEFLRNWPGYVKKTQAFFDHNLDLALGSAYVWTRSNRWLLTRWTSWLRLVLEVASPTHWPQMQADVRHLSRALRLPAVLPKPTLGRLLLDGSLNAFRDLLRRPRANLLSAGEVRVHYRVAGGAEPGGLPPATLRRWFGRFAPVLASAARLVYSNDNVQLAVKLPRAVQLLVKQVNVFDLLTGLFLGAAAGLSGAMLVGWDRLRQRLRRYGPGQKEGIESQPVKGLYRGYAAAAHRATDLTPAVAPAAQSWDARLARLSYESVKASHIHVLWPRALADKNNVVQAGLWHVCPAHVYEARADAGGSVQVVVNFENCIKCETCWRASDLVDWGRDGAHRFVYAVHSPAVERLLEDMSAAGLARPPQPLAKDWWAPVLEYLAQRLRDEAPALTAAQAEEIAKLRQLLATLERKLQEYEGAVAEEPRTVDRGRAEYLEMLARYAQQLAARVVEILRGRGLAEGWTTFAMAHRHLLTLATAALATAEEGARHAWDQRFAWAAADGRQLRQHHLPGMRRCLDLLTEHAGAAVEIINPTERWLRAEDDAAALADQTVQWRQRLDAVLPPSGWRDLERGTPLTAEQDRTLRELLAQVPAIDEKDLARTLHPPLRKWLLAELGRRDPSLAYVAASHLWARDLATLSASELAFADGVADTIEDGGWFTLAFFERLPPEDEEGAEALLVPARNNQWFLCVFGDQMSIAIPGALATEALPTLGLRGAGLVRVLQPKVTPPDVWGTIDRERILRLWTVLSAADLISIAFGMSDLLCRRAIEQATSRVQFPGLFHDEEARDTIGKFGAVKKMVAEIAARRYLLETLDHDLSPPDYGPASAARASQLKALAAELLGTAPGSVSYNAGQVFGGTGYSEDDLLSKYYRDAAAWRFLGPDNIQVFLRHGEGLLADWDAEGHQLSGLEGEAQLFDQLAQRKALQAELDEVRVHRSRVRSLVGEWRSVPPPAEQAERAAELCEALGRQDAYLLASKALLLRTHARLERGLPAETETALVRVWLDAAAAALGEFEGTVRRQLDRLGRRDDRPVVDPAAGPPVTAYADFLAAPCAYDSGDFLVKPADPLQPRYVPEMVHADPALAARNREFRDFLTAQFGGLRDGLGYERWIERSHRPSDADLDFLRRHGYFRLPVPREQGGEGRAKVDYYLLIVNAHRLADVAVSLTIQVSSSLGTTPVLLARDKDLPRAQKDLGPFVGDSALREEIRERLLKLQGLCKAADGPGLTQPATELKQRLDETVLARPVLRGLAGPFLEAWKKAGRAMALAGFDTAQAALQEALAAWQTVCGQAAELHEELGRRREACDLFLRWVASGQISAFALTEPSAGSDTARVATRARLHSVPVEVDADGVLRFVPAGGKEPRYLLDARRLEFRTAAVNGRAALRAFYRWSDTAEPSLIHFEEYDYETDDPSRLRYYDHGGRRIGFTDVAQLRKRDGLWYDYWELSGAKMWITNGRVCGILCLYAKTDAGVTGFIVDRQAEGLVVGKDEAKMGQCGSPTNELALQGVRVPRENVIGLEGRGQVNALETLNVGRAGLAMSAMAPMKRLIDWCRDSAQLSSADSPRPPWVSWRLQRMEEERFIAEALAFEVIGRFEHKQTRSIRLESAIAKMLVSELLHHLIETAEEIHGLAGQTERHLVEKRKRDARVLTIYEGTNEIQRFFILRDLAGEVAPRWRQEQPAAAAGYLSREAVELDALQAAVRQRAQAALEVFGQQLWQDPSLQANCFLMSEAVAWLAAADSALGRLAWLSRLARPDENAEPPPQVELGRRALARCGSEVRDRLKRFDEELTHLRRGYYAPEIRAAALLFRQAARTEPAAPPASRIARPLAVLAVLGPAVPGAPELHLADGRLLEPYRVLAEADRAALETALALRDAASEPCQVEVIAVGPASMVPLLREVISLGADRVRLVVPAGGEAVAADRAAAAVAVLLKGSGPFDLILGGGAGDGEEGLLAELTAAAVGMPFAGTATGLAVEAGQNDAVLLVSAAGQRTRPLPAAVAVEAGLALRPFTTQGYLAGLARDVEAISWPAEVPAAPVTLLPGGPAAGHAPADVKAEALQPWQASRLVLETAGLDRSHHAAPATKARKAGKTAGRIEEVTRPFFAGEAAAPVVLAVLATEADGGLRPTAERTLEAARLVAEALAPAVAAGALVLAPKDAQAQERTVADLAALGPVQAVLVPVDAEVSDEIKGRLLAECMSQLRASLPAVVGEPWTERAFATLGGRSLDRDRVLARVHDLDRREGQLAIETSRLAGKVRCRQLVRLARGATCWLALAAEAQVGAVSPAAGKLRVQRWPVALERFYGRDDVRRLLAELKQETGLVRLADAEIIIDVGFGVGNRDGYEAVIEPLERALRQRGARGLMVGGSRKVTEELHLLPADRQIGQSGVSVNPQVLLAIGVSGAPQHLSYIGPRATVVAFNRDPEAPIMTLNQRQPQPRVFPVVGDLFETVPAFVAALREEPAAEPAWPHQEITDGV
jgi:alkylation response protein AidB-like acyl-CoA dehydrogenase/flavin-dependent dehydrogenase/electron transfer flavoprotein alpha subunit/ferredoxin-like protein FixX